MQRSSKKKVFRIEQRYRDSAMGGNAGGAPVTDSMAEERHEELLQAINQLRNDLATGEIEVHEAHHEEEKPAVAGEVVDDYKRQVVEATNLRRDLQELSDAIEKTKVEIAALNKDSSDDKIHTASVELGAVVQDTEAATDRIIENAEAIDELAQRLQNQLEAEDEIAMADEMSERIVNIFEACNFQDITGQRITKVVNTMNFIDDRIKRMMDIWGGSELFKGLAPETTDDAPAGDTLHGPALPDERISQDDIDALFD